ncbi:LPXTG cell wall anchor domain-containing protein [Leucobacter sp. cx-42]|uniref:LPXTG cell wall anchor domain-containing protein n=1 Tax=unclassified Leucobacter TaxID=2621730 RepID=UPI00165D63F1|nr:MULTISPECIES: LPXTG cell wall anchor domain-containing protein [unclassified Leucobacter]MBC9954097.1 LPXTG cell wall anchor domain-containing protein [Leucobacter sp. cx-42]
MGKAVSKGDNSQKGALRSLRKGAIAIVAAAALIVGPGTVSAYALDDIAATTAEQIVETAPAEAPATEEAPAAAPAAEESAVAALVAEPAVEEAAEAATDADIAAPAASETDQAAAQTPAADAPAARAVSRSVDTPASSPATFGGNNGNSGNDGEIKKISLCHATSSAKNPYVLNEVSINSFLDTKDGSIAKNGHGFHGKDIIPPFSGTYKKKPVSFAGLNWDAKGQAVFGAKCDGKAEPPVVLAPKASYAADADCTAPISSRQATIRVTLSEITGGPAAQLTVTGPNTFSKTVTGLRDGEITVEVPGAGTYSAQLIVAGKTVSTTSIVVAVCASVIEPGIPVVNPELTVLGNADCLAANGARQAKITATLSQVPEGRVTNLSVSGPNGFTATLSDVRNGDSTVLVPGAGTYTVTITAGSFIASSAVEIAQCATPVKPVPTVSVVADADCLTAAADREASLRVTVGNIAAGAAGTVVVSNAAGEVDTVAVTENGDMTVPVPGAGSYTVQVTVDGASSSAAVSVPVCATPIQPALTSIVLNQECVALELPDGTTVETALVAGSTGSLTANGLVRGETYTLTAADAAGDAVNVAANGAIIGGGDAVGFTLHSTEPGDFTLTLTPADSANEVLTAQVTFNGCTFAEIDDEFEEYTPPVLTADPGACTDGTLSGRIMINFSNLQIGHEYRYTVSHEGTEQEHDTFVASATAEGIAFSSVVDGDYVVTLLNTKVERDAVRLTTFIEKCRSDINPGGENPDVEIPEEPELPSTPIDPDTEVPGDHEGPCTPMDGTDDFQSTPVGIVNKRPATVVAATNAPALANTGGAENSWLIALAATMLLGGASVLTMRRARRLSK